jgi:import inner membrane translocase subunit TIM23
MPVAIVGVESTQRLRVNQLLNSTGQRGRSAGNALGVIGLMFASFESFYGYLNDGALPEEAASLAAGATTGAVFRSVRGPRQAAAAGAVGLLGASLLLLARKTINAGL